MAPLEEGLPFSGQWTWTTKYTGQNSANPGQKLLLLLLRNPVHDMYFEISFCALLDQEVLDKVPESLFREMGLFLGKCNSMACRKSNSIFLSSFILNIKFFNLVLNLFYIVILIRFYKLKNFV